MLLVSQSTRSTFIPALSSLFLWTSGPRLVGTEGKRATTFRKKITVPTVGDEGGTGLIYWPAERVQELTKPFHVVATARHNLPERRDAQVFTHWLVYLGSPV